MQAGVGKRHQGDWQIGREASSRTCQTCRAKLQPQGPVGVPGPAGGHVSSEAALELPQPSFDRSGFVVTLESTGAKVERAGIRPW